MKTSSAGAVSAPFSRGSARTDLAPWYRQPWLWFVIAFPAISVVFSFATLYVAMSHADAVVPHDENEAVYSIPQPVVRGAAGIVPPPVAAPARPEREKHAP